MGTYPAGLLWVQGGTCCDQGHASAFPSASVGIRVGPSHAQKVMVFLPDSTCRQELDLKPIRGNWSPAGEWLLKSRVLPGNDWERAWHSDVYQDLYQGLYVQLPSAG